MSKLDFNAKIKSENAECLLNASKQSNIEGCPVPLGVAIRAVIFAEHEAEQRHAKEIEELIQAQGRRIYMIQCDRVDELNASKKRAMEAINTALCYYGCSKGKYCEEPCERRDLIIQKLTEKQ